MRHTEFGYWAPKAQDHTKRRPQPGDIVALTDFKPWRVIDIREGVPHRDNPDVKVTVYRLRPVGGDDNKQDIHRGWTLTGPPVLTDLVVPGGAPVTFHAGRWQCRKEMQRYRNQVGQQETQLRLDGGQEF